MTKWTALLLLLPALALAQTPNYTTCVNSEQLRNYQTVSGPKLSPDGKDVIWVQHESTADGAVSHIWLASVNDPQSARQITFSPASDKSGESSPEWAPDGSAIFFTAKRGESRQIFRMVEGSEAAPIELKTGKLDLSPGSFELSPNGQWLAFTAPQPQTAEQKKDKKDKKDAVVVGENKNPNRLWLYSFADKKVTALTPLTRSAHGFAWSPDSTELAVTTGAAENAGELEPDTTLEIVNVANPEQRRTLSGVPKTISTVEFSPDGKLLGFVAQTEHDNPPGVSDVYVVPVSGGTPRDLTGASEFTVAGRGFIWKSDSSAVYVQAQRRTRGALLEFPLSGSAPAWRPAATPIATEFDTNRRQSGWTFIAQSSDRMPQVVYASAPDQAGTVLSHANASWPSSGWQPSETVSWKGPDALTIYGLYFAPMKCDGGSPVVGGKSPMILIAHGGPTGSFIQTFNPFVQWLTAQGWAVLEVNPRGSTGYGWQFTAADRNDLGGKDYLDEMAGVDWALANKPVDAKRLGMFGYSYGGEMAGFIEGKTDRFAAIVSGAPVIDQYSEYGTERGWYYDKWFFGQPWMRPEDAWRQSGLSYAKNAKSPMLLLQGQADTTDPLGQSEEEYRALFAEGVPVRLVTFPRENHGPLAGGIFGSPSHEPWHGFQGRAEILAWYQKYFRKAEGQ